MVATVFAACQLANEASIRPTHEPIPDTEQTLDPTRGSIALQTILSGFQHPVFIGSPPGDQNDLYVVEQSGRIWSASKTADGWQSGALVADLTQRVLGYEQKTCWPEEFNDERGLLGLAFAPAFATTGVAYITYTKDEPCDSPDRGAMVISEINLRDAPDDSERVLLSIDKPADPSGHPRPNHQGGGLGFGPDGMLYIGLGEGGNGGGPLAESLGSDWGKLLRIDPRDPDGGGPLTYTVPQDNPYVGTDNALPEIWASGLRNPWRWSFDSANGDLWIGDVGQFRYESIDLAASDPSGMNAAKGLDFGWSRCEGAHQYDGSMPGDPEPSPCAVGSLPIYEYEHTDGRCAVLGGYLYRGDASQAWDGTYLFSDYCDGTIRAITAAGIIEGPKVEQPLTFGELADGELLLGVADGEILEIGLSGSPT